MHGGGGGRGFIETCARHRFLQMGLFADLVFTAG